MIQTQEEIFRRWSMQRTEREEASRRRQDRHNVTDYQLAYAYAVVEPLTRQVGETVARQMARLHALN